MPLLLNLEFSGFVIKKDSDISLGWVKVKTL